MNKATKLIVSDWLGLKSALDHAHIRSSEPFYRTNELLKKLRNYALDYKWYQTHEKDHD